jgi:proteasome accessory factor B
VRWVERPGAAEVLETLRVLSDALLARKRVRFQYEGIRTGEATERDVAPYGLFFCRDWYLVGHDATRDALRVFRIARMDEARPNRAAPKTPDYEIPAEFQLKEYLHRDAWALDEDAEPLWAQVRFSFPASAWAERNDEGELISEAANGSALRQFAVYRTGPFLRWVLSLAGDAEIVEPPELQAELARMAGETAALYEEGPSHV